MTSSQNKETENLIALYLEKYQNFHHHIKTIVETLEKYSDEFQSLYAHLLTMLGPDNHANFHFMINNPSVASSALFASKMVQFVESLDKEQKDLVEHWVSILTTDNTQYITAYKEISKKVLHWEDECMEIYLERLQPEEIALGIKLFRYIDFFMITVPQFAK